MSVLESDWSSYFRTWILRPWTRTQSLETQTLGTRDFMHYTPMMLSITYYFLHRDSAFKKYWHAFLSLLISRSARAWMLKFSYARTLLRLELKFCGLRRGLCGFGLSGLWYITDNNADIIWYHHTCGLLHGKYRNNVVRWQSSYQRGLCTHDILKLHSSICTNRCWFI